MIDLCLESTSLLGNFKGRSIIFSVDNDINFLDDKKEAVVMTQFSEKKPLTTEKVTTSDEVHKRTEKFTTSEEVVKSTDEVHK